LRRGRNREVVGQSEGKNQFKSTNTQK
jgi:hypothetical protein